MKHLAQDLYRVDAFSAEQAADVVAYLECLEDAYWYHRLKINSIPTQGTREADYFFLGDGQMPRDLKEHLNRLAPKIDGFGPAEICVNRYEIGNGMPEHIDKAFYRYNMVIALSDHADGLFIESEWHPDQPGKGVILPLKSPPHSVPAVKHRRYTLIYLYD